MGCSVAVHVYKDTQHIVTTIHNISINNHALVSLHFYPKLHIDRLHLEYALYFILLKSDYQFYYVLVSS
jgi:hypothetical protein